jgi:hypothetical protein
VSDREASPFRAEAYARYLSERTEAALPRLVRPRTFRILWSLVASLLAASAIAWFARVPVFATGTAVVASLPDASKGETLLVLMPVECAARWKRGEQLSVRPPRGEAWREATLVSTESEPVGPRAIEERFGLRGAAAASLDRPRAVATASWASDSGAFESTDEGTVLDARYELESRRVLSFVPLLGLLVEETR